ncbi:MAG: calcium-translocating P-type ATPase, SERCA-type [Tissierellia bacterium]|nr:calcium-translocating P-type ATPase, SERCA-type [Tissierellia bacterium]
MNYYLMTTEDTLKQLNSVVNGLSDKEAKKRLEEHGPNQLAEVAKKSFLSKLWAQFNDFLIFILLAAAIISFAVGERKDAVVILAIVVINAFLGIYQEGRAEKSVEALQKMAAPLAKAIRNGQVVELPAANLVPGDIIVLEAGDIVPADLRLLEASNLKVDESSLTGESVPVEKLSVDELSEEVGIGDRENMLYMSTIITYGRAKAVVCGTGHETEIGAIATKIQTYDTEATPLQIKLNQLGKVLGITTIIVCIIVFALGLFQKRPLLEMGLTAISLAVAAIPEGLPAIVTVVLAIGMNRMASRNAIVKKLLAVETLGATSVICSDKTGTLTQNEMTVVSVYTDDKLYDITGTGYEPTGEAQVDGNAVNLEEENQLMLLATIAGLANDAHLDFQQSPVTVVGDPTEGALVTLSDKLGPCKDELQAQYPRVADLPFDSERKMMTTFHNDFYTHPSVSLTKGAPDVVLGKCKYILEKNEIIPLTDDILNRIMKVNSGLASQALRVLALAFKPMDSVPQHPSSEDVENEMVFVGLVGMIDPPRPEAQEAIALCKKAGIETIMITGDYKETAFAIARDLGMVSNPDEAIEGKFLDDYDDAALRNLVKTVKVYSRVSPDHKVRIVNALKENGDIVAMTGDGVNDALALKKSDIGVSMGITGTDVAKNTAELILTDDNFATIVSAVEEGRIIYSNIKKFVYFLLSCNIGEILLVFVSILLGLPMPLLPIQLLWLNLVTDSFPAMALGVEPGEEGIMDVGPRNPSEPILDRRMAFSIAFQSIAIAAGSFLAYGQGIKLYGLDNLSHARTIAFSTIILAELLRALSARSFSHTIFQLGIFTNTKMIIALLGSFSLLLAVLYIPFLQGIFSTFAMGGKDWLIVLSFAFIPLIIGEVIKVINSKKRA